MVDEGKGESLDHTRSALMWIIFLLFVLYYGDPDLYTAVMNFLSK